MNIFEQSISLSQEEDTCLYQIPRRFEKLIDVPVNKITIINALLIFHKDVTKLDFEEIISLPNIMFIDQIRKAINYSSIKS